MGKYYIPNREKCLSMLEEYKTPDRPKKHCIEVARVALAIGKALNEKGYELDLDLLESAGLVHDMLRVEEHHGEKCAEVLENMGYEKITELVHDHMKFNFPNKEVNEMAVFCLADRLVLEDKYVGLEKRMQYVIEKHKGADDIKEIMERVIKTVQGYINYLEKECLGKSIDEMLRGYN